MTCDSPFSALEGEVIPEVAKATGTEEPHSAPLVPSICLPIFAERSWRFWAQELENV